MAHPIIPLIITISLSAAPAVNLHAQSKDPLTCLKNNPDLMLIAQKHGDDDPHGGDPHDENHSDSGAPGGPHDQNHDSKLPANEYKHYGKAPKDVYGGGIDD
jgi:hypothetical protein